MVARLDQHEHVGGGVVAERVALAVDAGQLERRRGRSEREGGVQCHLDLLLARDRRDGPVRSAVDAARERGPRAAPAGSTSRPSMRIVGEPGNSRATASSCVSIRSTRRTSRCRGRRARTRAARALRDGTGSRPSREARSRGHGCPARARHVRAPIASSATTATARRVAPSRVTSVHEAGLARGLRTRGGYLRCVRAPLHGMMRGLRYRRLPLPIFVALLALVAFTGCGGNRDPLHHRSQRRHEHAVAERGVHPVVDRRTALRRDSGTIIGRAQYSFPKGLGYAALAGSGAGRTGGRDAYLVFQPTKLWSKPVVNTGLPQGDLWVSATYTDAQSAGATTAVARARVREHESAAAPRGDRDGSGLSVVRGPPRRRPHSVHRVRRLGRSGEGARGDHERSPARGDAAAAAALACHEAGSRCRSSPESTDRDASRSCKRRSGLEARHRADRAAAVRRHDPAEPAAASETVDIASLHLTAAGARGLALRASEARPARLRGSGGRRARRCRARRH